VTWTSQPPQKPLIYGSWCNAAKVVASSKHPIIAGYCGDSIFGTTTLVQLLALMDSGSEPTDYESTIEAAHDIIRSSHSVYPYKSQAEFIVGVRYAPSEFAFSRIACLSPGESCVESLKVDRQTGLVGSWGSGHKAYKPKHEMWQRSDAAGFSRAIAGAFFDAIESGIDDKTGGPPQIVGLRRSGAGVVHGLVMNEKRFVSGMEISASAIQSISVPLEWRNRDFERCDPSSMEPLAKAQRQPRPRNVK